MNKIASFMDFVEIRTKTISVVSFLLGITYAWYLTGTLNIKNSIIFFIAMFLFDLETTAINNYIDSRAANSREHFSNKVSYLILFIIGVTSLLFGLYLVYITSILVLFVGMICFAVGICYTFGPAPISRTPYGELISGPFMGLAIPFLAIFINLPKDALIDVNSWYPIMKAHVNLPEMIKLVLVTLPLVFVISNIMLANNICDVERDVKINRYTLPFYLGTKKSLMLFEALYYLCYLVIIGMVIFRVIPPYAILTLVTILPVRKNIKIFKERQIKAETFPLSAKNHILIALPYIFLIALGVIMKR